MNSNVCVVTIIFLNLENVAGLICSTATFWRDRPSQQQQPSIGEPGDHDLEGNHEFTCFSPNLYHQWYQGYQNGSPQIAIGEISPQKGVKTTRFIIKVEEFDNNTEIYCKNSKEKTKHTRLVQVFKTVIGQINSHLNYDSKKHENSESYKTLIKIEANETCKENEEPTILKYNEKQNVSFSCLEYEHINKTTYIQLGLINTTSNMIKTFVANSTHEILNISQNGTILCCVYYVVNETEEEKWITRFVANKTLLVYVRQDALGGKDIILSNSTNSDADQGQQTIIITIITAVAVVFILLVIIVVCKKRCRKKPESDTKVLYADLDILRQIEPDSFPRLGPGEESPYAQIIGEMRPQLK